MTTPAPTPSGLMLIDKPLGPTSMRVCAAVRARLHRGGAPKRVKVGHAGTLDPRATGLLIILVGKATRCCGFFMGGEKEYHAAIDLGARSTTDDAEGDPTPVEVGTPPTRARVEQVIAERFVGEIMQAPPAFSAVHVDGRRAYRLARRGEAPVLPARPVYVRSFTVESFDWPVLTATITCGKGTYIRSLARDLGTALGTGGMLRALRRTRIGAFDVAQAISLDALPDVLTQADLRPVPVESHGA